MQSGVFIIPADQLDAGNAFGEAQGWGEKSLSVPLSATGQEPATHWGARADLSPSFFDLLTDPPLPLTLLTDEYDEDGNLMPMPLVPDQLLIHVREQGDAYGHWMYVLGEQGLQIVQSEEWP